MWLLDEGLPVSLFKSLNNLGVIVETVEFRGWKGMRNGNLVAASSQAGFTCILTKDKLFAQDAKKSLLLYPKIAVVLVLLPQLPKEKYLKNFEKCWSQSPVVPVPGNVTEWPK